MQEPSSSLWRPAPLGWAVYDLAYSIFSFLLLIRFLPAWVIDDLDRPDWYVSMTQLVVVLVVVVVMPVAGTLADQLGRRKPFLIVFTLGAAGAASVLGFLPSDGNVLPLLATAGIAAACGQLAFAQYDPLLADVAAPTARGKVSGLAVALGFIGTILGLVVVAEAIVGDGDKQQAFVPAAIAFVLFAIPAFLFVRERAHPHPGGVSIPQAFVQIGRTVREIRRHRSAFQFLAGRFLYSDAIATLTAFLAVYMERLGGFTEREKNLVIGVGVAAAAVGAILAGRLVERFGPRRPLLGVLPIFGACILLAAVTGQGWALWLASPVAGLALGFVWTADRVFMLVLTPPELRGQFFGFFNLASRVASAVGPLLIWSGTVWLLADQTDWLSRLDASRVALGGLALAALLGWMMIRPLSDQPLPASGPADLGPERTAPGLAR